MFQSSSICRGSKAQWFKSSYGGGTVVQTPHKAFSFVSSDHLQGSERRRSAVECWMLLPPERLKEAPASELRSFAECWLPVHGRPDEQGIKLYGTFRRSMSRVREHLRQAVAQQRESVLCNFARGNFSVIDQVVHPIKATQQRRLSAAGRSDERRYFFFGNLEVYTV